MADKNPTVYSARAWSFVTGNAQRGDHGVIHVPAGASDVLTEDDLKHWYVRLHVSDTPIAGLPTGTPSEDLAAALDKLGAMTAERDQLAAANGALTQEVEALRLAVGQSATEREAQLEGQLRTAKVEADNLRAQLAKAQAAAKPAR